jgi:23S rRNA pseudouridine2604 synthase
MTHDNTPIRINKYLADCGYATRASADKLIQEKKVYVNGVLATIGQKINLSDIVEVKNVKTTYHYYKYFKPTGITTTKDRNEIDIISHLKKQGLIQTQKLFPVGRLDKDSDGLIILTDDGRITNRLLNPDFFHEKEYFVTLGKPATASALERLARGVVLQKDLKIKRFKTRPAQIRKVSETEFYITITEGKNRQIRRMCSAVGLQLRTLTRIRILSITLGKMKPDTLLPFTTSEQKEFLTSLSLSV